MEKDLFNLCNNKIANMSNYIMFTIKARQMELTPELKAKNRAPIALSMGAPVEKVPEYVIKKSIEYMNVDSLHTYSTPKGEAKFLEAVKKEQKEGVSHGRRPLIGRWSASLRREKSDRPGLRPWRSRGSGGW